jgi:hypothetical protein
MRGPKKMDFTLCERISKNISRVIVGKDQAIELLLVGLLAEGHVLLEDVPGVAKTLLAKSLAKSIGGTFNRVQFTPDLLPADITGFNVYDQKTGNFSFHPGPVICNVLLADEINRTIPRTQSSLLECMEERAGAFFGHGNPESHRTGGNLSAARSPTGPVSIKNPAGLSGQKRRGPDTGTVSGNRSIPVAGSSGSTRGYFRAAENPTQHQRFTADSRIHNRYRPRNA